MKPNKKTDTLSRKLLTELTNAPGVPGDEGAVRDIVHGRLKKKKRHVFQMDRTGSLLCSREADPETKPRVMLTAHMDEVGFMVQGITRRGFISFVPLGGWWSHTLLAQAVNVFTSDGDPLPGVITSVPPHFLDEDARNKVLPIEKMYIDIGASSREEAEGWGVALGNSIVPAVTTQPLQNTNLLMGKAFDNRVGVSLLVQSMLGLHDKKLPNQLLGLATVQEEVGLRGARTATRMAKPDVALVLEGPPADDTPGFPEDECQGAMGRGVQIRMIDPTAIMNRPLVDFIREVAEKHNIPHQLTVRRSGGTDAGRIHLEEQGIPCVVLGVPARYIHTHRSIICLDDYHAALALIENLVPELDADVVRSFTPRL